MHVIRIATFGLATLLLAGPALANEPRTLENLFPGWTTEQTGLPSERAGSTEGSRVRDFATEDRYETGDQVAVAPGKSVPRFGRSPILSQDDAVTGPYSRQ
ncbi:hypothetical protein [Arenibaculum pallidiluteum]|uniref:hypothetical protein n=1 Tax=Arenibaculum pallidiluteum TaxID=2812559 RepID=UPI001A96C05D|nr:hypothetical protein [Arenibaculum pallidiluteum]